MDGSSPAGRLRDRLADRGAPIVLRRITRTAGPTPLVNPPENVDELALDGAAVAGASVVSLRSNTVLKGRLAAGDTLLIGMVEVTVLADAPARPLRAPMPGFDAVPVSPLGQAVADGTQVLPGYAADLPTFGMPGSMSTRLADGDRIRTTDLSMLVSAFGLPPVETAWQLLFGGRSYEIKAAIPAFERGEVVSYTLACR